MKRLIFFILLISLGINAYSRKVEQRSDREIWCEILYKIAAPVLQNMSRGELQKNMMVETSPTWDGRTVKVAYMECFGRLMDGLAPWMSLPDDNTKEGKMRKQLREWALLAYTNAVDPNSPDYLEWRRHDQALVDAAYLAESFLRGYEALWLPLDSLTKQRYIEEFTQLRRINPPYNNWLLFSATVETFLCKIGAPHDEYRIVSALRKTREWYVGDGWYADGPAFAYDYYNSFVIHPMYIGCLQIRVGSRGEKDDYKEALRRMQRYGVILERMISPEGTFPVFGRSITYRTAVLQPLAWLAWKEQLPSELSPGQVRAAMTTVIRNMFDGDQNFNQKGFLTLGFNGHQPEIADVYTNNGSLYLASEAFLPLGLSASHPFWTSESEAWTSKKAWEGMPFPRDKAYKQ